MQSIYKGQMELTFFDCLNITKKISLAFNRHSPLFSSVGRFSKPTCTRTWTCRMENMSITSSVFVMIKFNTYEHEWTYVKISKSCKVELVACIFLLTINLNKCVYFCKTLIFIATTDIKKHKFSLKCIVL